MLSSTCHGSWGGAFSLFLAWRLIGKPLYYLPNFSVNLKVSESYILCWPKSSFRFSIRCYGKTQANFLANHMHVCVCVCLCVCVCEEKALDSVDLETQQQQWGLQETKYVSCYLFILPSSVAQFRLWADSAQGKAAGRIQTIISTQDNNQRRKSTVFSGISYWRAETFKKTHSFGDWPELGYKPILPQQLSPLSTLHKRVVHLLQSMTLVDPLLWPKV